MDIQNSSPPQTLYMGDVLVLRDGVVDGAVNNVKSSISWDKCMSEAYCKWPVIAAIAIASLIVFSLLFCCIRCLCCGVECCCGCLSCCNACCPSPRGRGRKAMHEDNHVPLYQNSANPNAAAYKSHPPPAYRPQISAPSSAPQFAQFDVSKSRASANPDALPAMPSWETASERRVEVFDEPSEHVEMKDLSPTGRSSEKLGDAHQGLQPGRGTPGGLRPDMGSRLGSNNTYGHGASPLDERNSYLSSYSHSTAGLNRQPPPSLGPTPGYGHDAHSSYAHQPPLSPYGTHSPYDDVEKDPFPYGHRDNHQSEYSEVRQHSPVNGQGQQYRSQYDDTRQDPHSFGHDQQGYPQHDGHAPSRHANQSYPSQNPYHGYDDGPTTPAARSDYSGTTYGDYGGGNNYGHSQVHDSRQPDPYARDWDRGAAPTYSMQGNRF